jgi:hypothetical protein
MAGLGTSAAKGAVAGAAVGTAVPVVGNIVGGIVGGVVGGISSLFGSKKHYMLYYWDPVAYSWAFAVEGHPSQLKPVIADYTKNGIITARIRKGSPAPTAPPSGVAAKASGFNPWILVGIAGAGLLAFVLLKKRR